MKLRYLLDTNICIYIAKHRPLTVKQKFQQLEPETVGMSFVTYGELYYGAEKSQHREIALHKLAQLIIHIPVIPPIEQMAIQYGQLRARLEQAGTPIGNNDLWIAAHALALNLILVSNNTKEFERVPNLKVENWV
jgi:tRNA(fMet)-specific endonuclease VapC